MQWRDLMGPEKLVLSNKINLETLFPDIQNIKGIHKLWKEFKELHRQLYCENISSNVASKFGKDAKQWVRDFLEIYQSKQVTPYMHIFPNHVPEFLSKYGNLVMYTQQGMEKLNDKTTINFARSTNHNFRCFETATTEKEQT